MIGSPWGYFQSRICLIIIEPFSPTSQSSGLRPSKEAGGGSDQNRAGPQVGGAGQGRLRRWVPALPSLKPGRGSVSTLSLRGSEGPPRSFAEAAAGQWLLGEWAVNDLSPGGRGRGRGGRGMESAPPKCTWVIFNFQPSWEIGHLFF